MSSADEALRLADALEQGTFLLSAEREATAAELRRLHASNKKLHAWHQSAWQRGHAAGLNGLNEAMRQAEAHRRSDAWGNTQLTETLLRAEAQRDALLKSLQFAEAALSDIGDADREPGDDLAWCEARAAEALPRVRAAIAEVKGRNDF